MYGWRGKIGLIIPSNNTVIEPEMWAMRPDGISVHSARILSHGNTPEGIAEMQKSASRAVQELVAGGIGVIVYACLATSLVKGNEWTTALAAEIQATTGRQATTAAMATIEALRAVGGSRVAVAAPYPPRINELLAPFIEAAGLTVSAIKSLGMQNSLELWRIPQATIYELAASANTPDSDAVCIVATDLPTITVIDALERDLQKPVVTTNQAILWRALALSGVRQPISGFGRLLSARA
jgi:maleate isomerase